MNYEFRIRGQLSERTLYAFPGLRAQAEARDTLLIGEVADQAALHGVLTQIEALGLELIELRRQSPASGDGESPARGRP